MLWGPIRPARARLSPTGFVRPCHPYLAERPPSGPDWQDEIKWDRYRLIARKDGLRVRLWARTGTDYTTCLDRIRIAARVVQRMCWITSAVYLRQARSLIVSGSFQRVHMANMDCDWLSFGFLLALTLATAYSAVPRR